MEKEEIFEIIREERERETEALLAFLEQALEDKLDKPINKD